MNLSEGETGREVYTLPTPIRVNLRIKVMFLIRIMPETCRRRLIIRRGACAMNGESELHLILTSLLMVKRIVTIGADQGLPLKSLTLMMRTIIMNAEIEISPW